MGEFPHCPRPLRRRKMISVQQCCASWFAHSSLAYAECGEGRGRSERLAAGLGGGNGDPIANAAYHGPVYSHRAVAVPWPDSGGGRVQEFLTRLGSLDAVIVAVLLLGLVIGFLQGVLRQVFLLGAVYFGIVLAAQYYLVAATALAAIVPGGEARAYSTIGLLLMFIIAVCAINAVGYHVYRSTKLPFLAAADHVGGAMLGVVSAWLILTLTLTAVDFGLAIPLSGMEWAQQNTVQMLHNSIFIPAVHSGMPTLYETLRPWVPAGIPAPFST